MSVMWNCWNLGVIAYHGSAHHSQNSILGAYPSGVQEVGSWNVLNWACKEDEEQQATPLLQLPPLCVDWCAVWHYNAGGFYSFFVWLSLQFCGFNFFHVWAYRSELIMALMLNISTNKIPSLTQNTLARTLPAVVFPLNWFSIILPNPDLALSIWPPNDAV